MVTAMANTTAKNTKETPNPIIESLTSLFLD
jgi:hypothetical protein